MIGTIQCSVSSFVTLHFLQRNIVFLLFKPYRISFCNGPASATDQKLLWCSVKIALGCFGYDFSLADKGVGGGILDFQVSRHVEITISITQKLFVTGQQKYSFLERSLHWLSKNIKSFSKSKVRVSKVRNLSDACVFA